MKNKKWEKRKKALNILISACLMGINCRYNGKSEKINELEELKNKYNLIPVCPEIYGGLKTPRNPSEIVNNSGEDVTKEYKKGAEEILRFAKFYDCKYAILKERSPSCGYGKIYDGTFSKALIQGNGITADLLSKNGIKIIGESNIKTLL